MTNKFVVFLKNSVTQELKAEIIKGLAFLLGNIEVEGTRDGVKVVFKKKL